MPTIDDLPIDVVHMTVEKLYHSTLDDTMKYMSAMKAIYEFYVTVSEEAFVRQKTVWNLHFTESRMCIADGGPSEKYQDFQSFQKLGNCDLKHEAIV